MWAFFMSEFDTIYNAPGVTVVRERINPEELAKAAVRCGNVYLLQLMNRPRAEIKKANLIRLKSTRVPPYRSTG